MCANEEMPAPPPDAAAGACLRWASTTEARSAAARALMARRERIMVACGLCGVRFETYANGTYGVARSCSPAHRRRAYYLAHRDRERERDRHRRERRRVTGAAEQPCRRCGRLLTVPRTGRPRVYCTRTCRQLAYIERRRARAGAERGAGTTERLGLGC